MVLKFTGERIVPGADNCEPTFAQKMYQEHIARYALASQFVQGADVLDVGCGVGYGSQWLARAGAKSVLGIDLSESAIEHARKYYFHQVITYEPRDATKIELEQPVDLVTCFELIEHVDGQVEVLDGIKKALKKDGVLVISTPRPLDEIRTHFHVRELRFEQIFKLLKERFKYVKPFFERNYFTSFVGEACPKTINDVIPLVDNFSIEDADYFVFMASDERPERFDDARPLITMNDDSYVLTLEHDVSVLRNAENNHIARIRDLEGQYGEASAALQKAQSLEQIQAEASGLRQQVGDLRGELAAFVANRDETTQLRENLARISEKLAEAETAAFSARKEGEDLRGQVVRLSSELAEAGELREILSDYSARLADAESEAFRLKDAQSRAEDLERELHAVRGLLDRAEATLARFRRSVSWYVTRPIRWIGRTFKRLVGRRA